MKMIHNQNPVLTFKKIQLSKTLPVWKTDIFLNKPGRDPSTHTPFSTNRLIFKHKKSIIKS